MKPLLLSLLSVCFLFSCTPQPTPVIPVEQPKPVEMRSEWPNKQWDSIFLASLDQYGLPMLEQVPSDFASYCPNFTNMNRDQRKGFYLQLFSALAQYESSFNPKSTYREPDIHDKNGNNVISAGVFQLSVESGNLYGCGLKNTEALFDVKTNFDCAVRIANRWVGERDKRIASAASPWLGIARYWSPFRKADKKAAIMKKTTALSYCKI